MAESIILQNGKVVRKNGLEIIGYFTTGHLATFKTSDGNIYTCASYLDSSKQLTFYVQENSFYENIEKGEYGKMKIYEEGNWENAKTGDTIKIKRREIDVSNTWDPSYCWNVYTKQYENGDVFIKDKNIPTQNFTKQISESFCNNTILTETAIQYFKNNVILTTNPVIKNQIADIAQLINNIDIYIYEAFTSPIESLKENQKILWRTVNASSLDNTQKEKYYNDYYIDLLNYYNEGKKRLYLLNNSTDIEKTIITAMSMHPKILIGLNVQVKIDILKYLVVKYLSKYKDKVEYEEFIVNLTYSFEESDTSNINLFLDELINPTNSISDSTQKKVPTSEEFELSKNSATLFEAVYTRMSQSWDITESSITLINYLPFVNFDPVLTRQNFVDAVYRLWRYSKFNPYKDNIYNDQLLSLVEDNTNTTFKYSKRPAIKYNANMTFTIDKTSAPVVLNYKSENRIGMFYQNFIFEFTGSNKICALTNDWNIVKPSQNISEPAISREWFPYGYYDIYQPVTLIDHSSDTSIPILTVDNRDPSGNLDNYNSIVPIFYIKYIAELKKRKNAEFLIFRAVDLITFFQGSAGLASKLTHIRHLSKFEQIIVFKDALQLTISETNFVLSFISSCNNLEFCRKLKTLLMWLEFGFLGFDAMSALQKKVAAKKFIKEVEDNGIPSNFDTPEGHKVITYAEELAEGTADLALIIEKLVDEIFNQIKPNLIKRFKKSNGGLVEKHFNVHFPDDKLKLFIKQCIDLDFENPKFIEDVVAMACRSSKRSTYDELLIQINYYKKVILAKGFPSGFENLADFKLYCTKATSFFEFLPFIGGKVIDYRVQGSVFFKRAEGIDPPDPSNTPFLINNPPGDLDIQLLMSRSNAIVLLNRIRWKWNQYLKTLERNTNEYKDVEKLLKTLDKKVLDNDIGGMIYGDLIFDQFPGDIKTAYRNAIKNNGEDLFKVTDPSSGKVEIGFSIIIKDSIYDILPVMSFKK